MKKIILFVFLLSFSAYAEEGPSCNKNMGEAIVGGLVSAAAGFVLDRAIPRDRPSPTPRPVEHHEPISPPEHRNDPPPAPCPAPGNN